MYFALHLLFGADIMDQIHKQVQVFLHSCNTTSLEEVETRALADFGELQKRVERGEWITTPSAWVEIPEKNNDGRKRLVSGGGARRSIPGGEKLGQQQNMEDGRNPDMDPRIRAMEILREFFCGTNRDIITCLKGEVDREVCINFHSKGNCTRDFSQ